MLGQNRGAVRRLVRSLRAVQEQENLTAVELAERLGISDSMLNMVYRGARQPGPRFLHGVLKAYPHLRDQVRLFLLEDITYSEEDDMF